MGIRDVLVIVGGERARTRGRASRRGQVTPVGLPDRGRRIEAEHTGPGLTGGHRPNPQLLP